MAKNPRTDVEIMKDHFRGLPAILDMMQPVDLVEFSDRVDGELFLDKASIMSLHRMGFILRRPDDGVYYWPLTMRHDDAWKIAA